MPVKTDHPTAAQVDARAAAGERLRRLNEERRGQARSAPAEPEPSAVATAERPAETGDPMDDLFQKLGAALQQTGANRATRNAQIADLEALLTKINPREHPDLVESPVVQQFLEVLTEQNATRNTDDPPGTIYNQGTLAAYKKRWQWRDVARAFPAPGGGPLDIETVEITPNETILVTWNGLAYQFVADIQQWVPRPHYEVFQEHRRGMRAAAEHAEMLFGDRRVVGADPSIVGPATSRTRGYGKGTYLPGGGGNGILTGEVEGGGQS